MQQAEHWDSNKRSDSNPSPLTAAIAHYATDPIDATAAANARAIAKLSLLDWAAVAIAGSQEPVSKIVQHMVESEAGTPQASVVGLNTRVPARAAALANGTTSHALDYDDTHFLYLGHPSVAVIPAALAAAEATDVSAEKFLEAILIGAETACRIGQWLGRSHYEHGFHQTATSGSFGAAMAAARLMKLSPLQAQHALGLVATRASGLKVQFGSMGKPYHAGMAAANGVEAASLAAAGFTARPDALEAPNGFAATHHGERGTTTELLSDLAQLIDSKPCSISFMRVVMVLMPPSRPC